MALHNDRPISDRYWAISICFRMEACLVLILASQCKSFIFNPCTCIKLFSPYQWTYDHSTTFGNASASFIQSLKDMRKYEKHRKVKLPWLGFEQIFGLPMLYHHDHHHDHSSCLDWDSNRRSLDCRSKEKKILILIREVAHRCHQDWFWNEGRFLKKYYSLSQANGNFTIKYF
jgi:hypothetical protein